MVLYMCIYTYIGWNPSLPLPGPLQRLCWQELLRGCVNHEGVPNFWRLFSQLPGAAPLQPPSSGTLSCSWPSAGPCTSRGLIPQTDEGGKGRCSPEGKKRGVNTRDILYHDCTCLQKMFHVTWLQKLPLQGLLFL